MRWRGETIEEEVASRDDGLTVKETPFEFLCCTLL
jgi:hypothetical protein